MKNNGWAAWMALLLAVTVARGELVRNGNFARDLPHWQISREAGYGHQPQFRVQEGALTATGLKDVAAYYLVIRQALDISKGKTYALSFEYRGTPGSKFQVAVGELDPTLQPPQTHYHKSHLEPQSDWQRFEATFEGKYDTDSNWYRQWVSESRGFKITGGRTQGFSKLPPRRNPGVASRSPLTFLIGSLNGDFAIRNVSVVEVVK